MRLRSFGLGVLLLLLAAGPAHAEPPPPPDYDRAGFYLQLGGVFALNAFEDEGKEEIEDRLGADVSFDVDDSGGFWVRAGYRMNSIVALELDYEWIEGFDFDGSSAGLDFDGSTRVQIWTGNVKAFVMTGRWQPYALVGLGALMGDRAVIGHNEDVDLALRFGVGLDAYITDSWSAVAEVGYVLPTGDVNALDYLPFRLGVQYRF